MPSYFQRLRGCSRDRVASPPASPPGGHARRVVMPADSPPAVKAEPRECPSCLCTPVKRRRLSGKAGASVYRQFGYPEPAEGPRPAEQPQVGRRKQAIPLANIPRGSPDHDFLEVRRLPGFVASMAEATDMQAVAESLKNVCAIQMPLGGFCRPVEVVIGTLCSGSEMYLTALPELQAVVRAAMGAEVVLRHAWSCEFVRWKREWIWKNFAPARIFVDAAHLCQDDGAHDDVSGCKQAVECCSVLIAGFSCKDASTLNTHHKERKDCIRSGEGTTGATFWHLRNIVKRQQPLLVIMENVPSLSSAADCGQSNLDFVREAFAEIGYKFVWRIFDATDVGAPARRRRLYMTAYKASQALVEEDAAQMRVHAALDRMFDAAEQHHVDDFLCAEAVVPSWSPHQSRIACRDSWTQKHAPLWKQAPHAADKSAYQKSLAENVSFKALTARQQDLLLLRLCSFPFPGPTSGAVSLQHGCKLARYSSALPTQLPTAQYWLVNRSRLQLGAEAMALQGADLVDLPACRPGGPFTDRQLQNLAGNAFHVWQFVVWFLATFEAIQF